MTNYSQHAYAALLGLSFACATLLGCHSTPAPAKPTATTQSIPAYPARPTTPPPTFHLFHATPDSLTLVVPDTTTDTQLAALLYQLHDAARTHTFAALQLPQSFIDHRDPIVFIHIYRGSKCASEKYTTGAYPCGPSYHAAADYTLGSFKNPGRDDAAILHDESHQTELWNPDAPPAGASQK